MDEERTEEERVEEEKSPENLVGRVRELEQELKTKELEAYKLKRLSELGLKPSYSEFLRGGNEEEFERSLVTFLEEQKKALATSGLKEAPRGPGIVTLSPEEAARREIVAISKRRLQ